jgi:hypothetical protein
MEFNFKHGSVTNTILCQSAATGSNNYCVMDGNDLLVLEFLALVIHVTVLIVIPSKFKQLVIFSSAYPNFGVRVTIFCGNFCHRAPEKTYPLICSGSKVR